jgi:hypothetical protein
MPKQIDAIDTISGKEGVAYANIGGNNEELFFARSIEATVEKTKAEVNAIGKRVTGHKTIGMNITGSMTIYYLTPLFRNMLSQYKKTGQDAYFNMTIENNDPSSAAGRQTVLLIGVNLDSTDLTKLDGDSSDPLDEEFDFTCEDFDILTPFTVFTPRAGGTITNE